MWKNHYLSSSVIKSRKDRIFLEDEDLVYEYFRLVSRKDIRHSLNLFSKDAVIHEPFTEKEGQGLSVKPLIMTIMRIHDLMHYSPYEKLHIEWLDRYHNENHRSISCALTVQRSKKILFNFKLGYDNDNDKSNLRNRRIKFLKVQFMN